MHEYITKGSARAKNEKTTQEKVLGFFLKTDPIKGINIGSEDKYKNSNIKERT